MIANQNSGGVGSASRLENIERIDLTGSGNNTVKLNAKDVFDMAGMNNFNNANGWTDGTYNLAAGGATPESRHQLVIDGNAGDAVNLSDFASWTKAGTVTNASHTYNVYTHKSAANELLIDPLLTIQLPA
ncbi:MAG: hypothetical protein WC742_09565 [Gallionellaceae bacterium]|jgi:hypothetical protein